MILKEAIYSKKYERTFFALGTINTIAAFGINCEEALNAACERFFDIDDTMSAFKDSSDVMKINRNAGYEPQKIKSEHLICLNGHWIFQRLRKVPLT